MSDRAAIDGDYADFRIVKTRSVAQVTIEFPIEQAQEIVRFFGVPMPSKPVRLAVARLAGAPQIEASATPVGEEPEPRRWSNLKRAQQAGIRCAEKSFQAFLREQGQPQVTDTDKAAEYVRMVCGNLHSRAELDTRETAGRLWNDLDGRYRAWMAVG